MGLRDLFPSLCPQPVSLAAPDLSICRGYVNQRSKKNKTGAFFPSTLQDRSPRLQQAPRDLVVPISHSQQQPARSWDSKAGLTFLGDLEKVIIHRNSGFHLSKTTESFSSRDSMDVSCFHSHPVFDLGVEGRFEPRGASHRKPCSSLGFTGKPTKTDSELSPTSL